MVVRHWLTRASPSPHVSHLEHRLNATTFKMSIVLYYMKKKKFASLLLEIDTKRKIVASSSSKRRNINRFTIEYAATIFKVLEFGTVWCKFGKPLWGTKALALVLIASWQLVAPPCKMREREMIKAQPCRHLIKRWQQSSYSTCTCFAVATFNKAG